MPLKLHFGSWYQTDVLFCFMSIHFLEKRLIFIYIVVRIHCPMKSYPFVGLI